VKVGIFGLNSGTTYGPEPLARLSARAEELGYESLWVGEHVVVPDPRVPPSPMEPEDPILDPAVALTWMAAATSRVLLGTGIVILPQRNPVVLAKELASLDVLSAGRLLFGLGVGYLEPEMSAIGVPMEDRGRRSLEYLEAMQALWAGPRAEYSGTHVGFSGVTCTPRPVQAGGPPVIMGGHTAPAYRRTVTHGHGWYGFARTPEQVAEDVAGIRAAAERHERPSSLGEIEISVTPRPPVDADTVARLADLGVHRVILLLPMGRPVDDIEAFLESSASLLAG
jgi:probable F420-dependent oxidoreductase